MSLKFQLLFSLCQPVLVTVLCSVVYTVYSFKWRELESCNKRLVAAGSIDFLHALKRLL